MLHINEDSLEPAWWKMIQKVIQTSSKTDISRYLLDIFLRYLRTVGSRCDPIRLSVSEVTTSGISTAGALQVGDGEANLARTISITIQGVSTTDLSALTMIFDMTPTPPMPKTLWS